MGRAINMEFLAEEEKKLGQGFHLFEVLVSVVILKIQPLIIMTKRHRLKKLIEMTWEKPV